MYAQPTSRYATIRKAVNHFDLVVRLQLKKVEQYQARDLIAADEVHIPIASEADILTARKQGRELAEKLGFWSVEKMFIAMAISEIALNILQYAGRGEIVLGITERGDGTRGILIIAHDQGPGIANVELAMQGGYGLSGAKRLMDEFEIRSEPGKGTTVIMKKWIR